MRHFLMAALLLSATPCVFAHGDIHERIESLSREIKSAPHDAQQYIRRGQLYLDAAHPRYALEDFDAAMKLDAARSDIHFYRAQALLALGSTKQALAEANLFLQHAESDAARARALRLRGDIYAHDKKYDEAAIDYTQVIEQKGKGKLALPDDYVLVADTYLAASVKNATIALDWLNRGIKKLGSLAVLEERALDLELQQQHYDDALARLDRLLAQGQRQAFLLYRKGTVEEQKGDRDAATLSYRAALTALKNLAPERAATPAFKKLRGDIEQKLAANVNSQH